MKSEHRFSVIVGVLILAFIGMCMVKQVTPGMIHGIIVFSIPLIWLDRIGAGIEWVLEYLVRKD